jgi:hypothetical protein
VSRHSAAVFLDLASIWLRFQAQQDEAPAAEGSPVAYAGWAVPAHQPQLASDGAAS